MGNWLEVTSWALAVMALGIAAVHLREARKQSHDLESQGKRLLVVTESLSTRYLGAFPDYLPTVVDIVEGVKRDLLIVVGNPVPAYFTDPKTYTRYHHGIERAVRSGVNVRMVCMSERCRRLRLAAQFPATEQDWVVWKPKNWGLIEEFLKYRFADVSVASVDHATLLTLLTKVQNDLLREDFQLCGVEAVEVDEVVPVQLWIADEERAVFSIQNSSQPTMSHGLYTSDRSFIGALKLMAEQYRADALMAVEEAK